MSWLLGMADAIEPGTALFVIFNSVVLYGALLSLIAIPRRASFLAVVVALLIAATPQFLIYPGAVWKDVLFAHAAIAGFACLAQAAARWQTRRLRLALIALGVAFFVLAALARQNGILILLAGAAGTGWIAHSQASERKTAALLVFGGGALAAGLLAMTLANAALHLRKVGDSGAWAQFQLLELYDIVGMTKADPALDLHQFSQHEPALEAAVRSDGVKLYTPLRNDPLASSPRLQSALKNASPSTVFRQWRDLVIFHPWLYLRQRASVFWQVLATPDVSLCLPYIVGVSGPEPQMRALGIAAREDDRDQALDAYASRLEPTPLFSHLAFLVLGVFCAIVLVRRGEPADRAIAAMLGGVALFTASFFAISIACDYRYLYAIDLSAMTALFYLALDPASAWRALRPR